MSDRGTEPIGPPAEDAPERYSALWDPARRPDLAAFLAAEGELPPAELAAVLRVDLRRRWEAGERPGAEDYLRDFPRVRDDPDAALDLIHAEFLVRERLGEGPAREDFLRRFPEWADALAAQIDLHLALATAFDSANAAGTDLSTRAGSGRAAEDPEPTLPHEFGRYRIEAVLGRGGMGTVYRAFDTRLERSVALKVPRLGDDPTGRLASRFEREARIAATFTHPNLCPVYDVGRRDGFTYLTMPLLAGEPLSDRLRRDGPLPSAEAARLAAKVARAVDVAHAAGVVHRDLKPANVMINPAGEPIVMDFGLARRAGPVDAHATESGVILGTIAYMAPEQIGGPHGAAGPVCDVYSLGAMLYHMIAGRPPFVGPPHQILREALAAVPDDPSRHRGGVAPAVAAACLKALAKRPSDRFASMAEFAAALEAVADDGPASPRSPNRPTRRRRTARPVPIGLGILALAAVGLAAWSSLARRAGSDPLPAGSEWVGEFQFRPPIGDYRGDVAVSVRDRRGDWFRGDYRAERGRYHWEIEGTLHDRQVRWAFTRAIRDNDKHDVVGRARVEGRLEGSTMTLTFQQPDDTIADMTLTRISP
jgi:serine/threonine-protein kinase